MKHNVGDIIPADRYADLTVGLDLDLPEEPVFFSDDGMFRGRVLADGSVELTERL